MSSLGFDAKLENEVLGKNKMLKVVEGNQKTLAILKQRKQQQKIENELQRIKKDRTIETGIKNQQLKELQ